MTDTFVVISAVYWIVAFNRNLLGSALKPASSALVVGACRSHWANQQSSRVILHLRQLGFSQDFGQCYCDKICKLKAYFAFCWCNTMIFAMSHLNSGPCAICSIVKDVKSVLSFLSWWNITEIWCALKHMQLHETLQKSEVHWNIKKSDLRRNPARQTKNKHHDTKGLRPWIRSAAHSKAMRSTCFSRSAIVSPLFVVIKCLE